MMDEQEKRKDRAGEGKSRPRVLVSACLLDFKCRYDGKGELNDEVHALMREADLIPICPEIYGGLATPREPAERVGERVVTKSGTDVTVQYKKGARAALHLAELYGCTCALLKERSPSCGSGMIYDGSYTGKTIPGYGVCSELLKEHGIAVFGESRVDECRKFLEAGGKVCYNQSPE